MLKNTIKEADLVQMLWDKLIELSTSYKEGTYNKADPTKYERVHSAVWLEYGYSTYIDEDGAEYPESEVLRIMAYDCTWGIDFEVRTSKGTFKGYWAINISSFRENNKEGGEWTHGDEEFFKIAYDILMYGRLQPSELDFIEDYSNANR